MAVELPAVEEALHMGDVAMARDIVPPSVGLPAWRAVDTWVLDLWAELRTPLAMGSQLAILRWRCHAEGMARGAAAEIWTRVCWIERTIHAYLADVRASRGG